MRAPALLLALLLLTDRAGAAEDEWWGRDKALHFGVSALLAGGGYAASTWLVEPRWQRFGLGASTALTLGAAKEAYDAAGGGDASYRDFTWDAAGALVGASVGLLVDLALASPQSSGAGATANGVVIRW